ncbi:MAG: hypothetical protein SFV51_22955 [Bryobacteraceae bacterium]|nr:hypothetical protein [Bryobacteraceae bacterium]
MALHDDLLEVAQQFASLSGGHLDQAYLRRAVSTAYYALFHLLTSEAAANWSRPELRAKLARHFDHGPMKAACESRISQIQAEFKRNPPEGEDDEAMIQLWTVANAFVQAQDRRNHADYNVAWTWHRSEVDSHVAEVAPAIQAWSTIRNHDAAQDFLLSLLGAKDRRPSEPRPPNPRPERRNRLTGPDQK